MSCCKPVTTAPEGLCYTSVLLKVTNRRAKRNPSEDNASYATPVQVQHGTMVEEHLSGAAVLSSWGRAPERGCYSLQLRMSAWAWLLLSPAEDERKHHSLGTLITSQIRRDVLQRCSLVKSTSRDKAWMPSGACIVLYTQAYIDESPTLTYLIIAIRNCCDAWNRYLNYFYVMSTIYIQQRKQRAECGNGDPFVWHLAWCNILVDKTKIISLQIITSRFHPKNKLTIHNIAHIYSNLPPLLMMNNWWQCIV